MANLEKSGVQLVAEGATQFQADMGRAGAAVDGFSTATGRAASATSGFGQIAIGAFRQVGALAVDAFAKASRAALSFASDSISVAGDFEAGMADFSVAVGDSLNDTSLKLDDFRNDFLQIGKELPVSTSEVQQAAVELIKGGVDPLALHMGGLKESIQFATAAGVDLTEAAEISARQLGIWVDAAADGATQAAFLAKSHDILVKAAGASTVGVDDLAKAMNIAGGQAKALNLDYKDFATGMADIAPAFNSTEEAGTSFKNFLARLQPTTKSQVGAMQALGLYTEEAGSAFFDAEGHFVGVRKAAELLQGATKDLTEEQRASLLQTIFGNDAMGAAVRLATTGAQGYDTLAAKMDKASGVAATAAEKQKGWNTALDNAKGSLETLQIVLGTKALPVLTDFLNKGVAPAINMITDLVDVGHITQQTYDGLTPTMQKVASGISAAMATIQGVIGAVQEKIGIFQETLKLWDSGIVSHKTLLEALGLSDEAAGIIDTMIGKIGDLSAPILDFASTVQGAFSDGGIVSAIQVVIDKFAEISPAFALVKGAAEAAFPPIAAIVTDVFGIIQTVIDEHGAQMLADVQGVWDGIWSVISGILPPIQDIISEVFGFVASFIHENGDDISSFLKTTWDQIFEIINTALALIKAVLVPVLTFIAGFIRQHGDEISASLKASWEIIKAVIDAALTVIKGVLKAALQIIQGDWEGAWETMKATGERLVADILQVITSGLDLIKGSFDLAIDAILGIWDGLIGQSAGIGNDIVHGIIEGIRNASSELFSTLRDLASDALQSAKDAIGIGSPSRDFAEQMGRPIVDGIGMGIEEQLPALLEQVSAIGSQIADSMRRAAGGSLSDLIGSGWGGGGGSSGWGGGGGSSGGGSAWGSGLIAPTASPQQIASTPRAAAATYNQQRSVEIVYNTAVAPPVSQSLALAQALV